MCNRTNSSLVTAEDVAKHFQVSVGTVNGWVRRGQIPCVRPSYRIIRFRIADVERAIERPARHTEAVG